MIHEQKNAYLPIYSLAEEKTTAKESSLNTKYRPHERYWRFVAWGYRFFSVFLCLWLCFVQKLKRSKAAADRSTDASRSCQDEADQDHDTDLLSASSLPPPAQLLMGGHSLLSETGLIFLLWHPLPPSTKGHEREWLIHLSVFYASVCVCVCAWPISAALTPGWHFCLPG